MKKMMLLLGILTTCVLSTYAQNDNEDKNDRIEAYKIAFITEKLNLTPKEASVFWPVYNEYNDKISSLRSKEHDRVKTFNQKENPNDAEADQFIKEYLAYKAQQAELTKKYIAEFKKVLPISKVARLVTLEQEFKMQLLQQFKDRKAAKSTK
jgi:hypothetical protein